MFQVRVVRLQHRVRPDAPVEDIWRLLGTTNVPHEKRALWEANDLRLGDGARIAADRMNELVTETPDRKASVSTLRVRENFDFVLSVGTEREALNLLWTDPAGLLNGRRFEGALPAFRIVCRRDAEDPEAVRLALVPEVVYGRESLRWVRTEQGVVQRLGRPSFVLADLAAEVRLRPGRLLVIGARQTSEVSLGGAAFYERRGPDMWFQTIILTAERLAPGRAPEAENVPFLPLPKPAAAEPPADGKAPTPTPAIPTKKT